MTSTSYTYEEKAEILLTYAKAYYQRGPLIQYDQYSMDRLVRITPRNTRYATPEMANEQHMLFLDCSTFIYTIFYQTFGYQLESNLTWHIPNMLKPCVYKYTLTGQETLEEKNEIIAQIRATLKPGDVLNKVRHSGSGHVMLYAGDNMIYHSTSHQFPESYQYKTMVESFYDHGTIHYNSLDTNINTGNENPSIFAPNVKSVQILRPLEIMGDPTPVAISRWKESADLTYSILSSHPGGKTAQAGDLVTYTLSVSNLGTKIRTVALRIEDTPQLVSLSDQKLCSFSVLPGECLQKEFSFRLGAVSSPVCNAPQFIANNIPIWAERVLVAPRIEEKQLKKIVSDVVCNTSGTLYEQIVSGYKAEGITLPPTPFRLLFPCFRLIDSSAGDVLWRIPQRPEADMALYAYFGGTGVITPEICADTNIRTQKVWTRDLQPGDFILISDNPEFSKLHCLFFTDKGILQQFADESICFIPFGENTNKLIETLPGRFCFITFRPQQQNSEPIDQIILHKLLKY